MKNPLWPSCALLLAVSTCGCSVRTAALRVTAGLLEEGVPSLREEPDPALAKDALPAQIKLLEGLLRNDPDNRQILGSLSEGCVGYAFLFLEDSEPERAAAMYRRALGHALRLAGLNPALAGLSSKPPERLEAALRSAGSRDVPGLYWAAYAWAGWANLAKGDPEALTGMSKSARIMERVRFLDPGFHFGGPDLFFGVYYSARPAMAGGDLPKSRQSFEAALARTSGRFLMAKVLYAQYYAVGALDETLFRRLNSEVLAEPASILPEARLANEVAKLKAKRLLEKTNELF